MPNYPTDLTTSDWIDYLETLPTREEKIAALATLHRRIERQSVEGTLQVIVDVSKVDAKTAADPVVKAARRKFDEVQPTDPQQQDYIPAADTDPRRF